ncbi:zinc finger protein ZFMSA12A-like isoform X2 [Phymastichus coffea]|uniref:zinc finger protein ZFMSA12A-like isoform X2 n=1 Tax=Phymastichus coffea TaxID=108790 RepID=UPI00273C580C|nr:zinc finger protein ZFMSA12A-like isoform X2 [Phymastichus coffea]
MDSMDTSLGSQLVETNRTDVQDQMPVPKEEIVDIQADDSDPDIIEVHCNIDSNRVNIFKRHVPNKFQRMISKNNVKHIAKKQLNFNIKEEIVISDTSDIEYDSSSKNSSKSSYSMRRNKEDSLSSITLNCPKCNKTKTVFSTTLTTECKECKVNMTFLCNQCNLKYESLIALYRHKQIQCKKYTSPIKQFVHKCTKCKVKYKIFKLSRPKSCHKCKSIMAYECSVCGKEHSSHPVIYRHTKDQCQSKSRIYYCNDCQFKSSSQRQLVLHLSSCHQNLYLLNTSCDKCGRGFANHLSLKQHKNVCRLPYYYCKICPYRPRLKVSLKRHLTMIHNISKDEIEMMVESSICPQSYIKASAIDETIKKTDDFTLKQLSNVTCRDCNHTQLIKKGQIKCNNCKKDLAFQCLYCPMRFRMISLLQRHSRRMHGKVEHVCSICKKPFSFLGDYNDHKKSCGKEPRFNCHLCTFKTKYRHNLKGHLENLHNTNRPLFVCQDCGMGYKTEKAMTRHFEVGCSGNIKLKTK